MSLIRKHIKWIMLLSGAITGSMLFAAFAPNLAIRAMFGETLTSPLSNIIVRNWGVLIGLVGLMLIYGAFNPDSRRLALGIAALSKIAFISLVLIFGRQFLPQVGASLIFDALLVVLFVSYLLGETSSQDAA